MGGALVGLEATAGLGAEVLGLEFIEVPEGTYEVGEEDMEDNPLRREAISRFELAKTPTTNKQMSAAMRALKGQTTVLMVEIERDRRWAVAARGTRKEVGDIRLATLRDKLGEVVSEGRPAHSRSAERVGDIAVEGSLQAFDLHPPSSRIVPVTLEAHLPEGFDRPEQPALVSAFEASAVAALFGLGLPTGVEWEIAAGELRDRRYRNERELRKVAHFRPATATADVGTKEPNGRGFYDILGNVWEAMANRYRDNSEHREFRGGSWGSDPEGVRPALRGGYHPGSWVRNGGFRLSRPQDSRR